MVVDGLRDRGAGEGWGPDRPEFSQNLASAYVFLASRENARAMMGVIVHVDAGSSLRMPRRS